MGNYFKKQGSNLDLRVNLLSFPSPKRLRINFGGNPGFPVLGPGFPQDDFVFRYNEKQSHFLS